VNSPGQAGICQPADDRCFAHALPGEVSPKLKEPKPLLTLELPVVISGYEHIEENTNLMKLRERR
jgi:hypothetical protein